MAMPTENTVATTKYLQNGQNGYDHVFYQKGGFRKMSVELATVVTIESTSLKQVS
jgi:hypothetical protein